MYAFVFGVFSTSTPCLAASFTGIGLLPGHTFSEALGVSGNGEVVTGFGISPSDFTALTWTQSSGIQSLPHIPGSTLQSLANGASYDGSVVVGRDLTSHFHAVRWVGTSPQQLNEPAGRTSSDALSASSDGSVIVGNMQGGGTGQEAFRWVEGVGMVGLGDLPGGAFQSLANGVSADGNIVVGNGTSANGWEAFKWTDSTGPVGLGDLDGGLFASFASDISADGIVIVGSGTDNLGTTATRWTQTGIESLGNALGETRAFGVSGDGSIIVGDWDSGSGIGSFIWDESNGMRDLQDLLTQDYGLDLTGWSLRAAQGISDDGLIIVGAGLNPDGQFEGWVVNLAPIPLPPAIWLFGSGLLGLIGIARMKAA
jgi:probable HAF family extracellular repeat protein